MHTGKSCRDQDIKLVLRPPKVMTWIQIVGDWFLLEMICKNLHLESVNVLIFQLSQSYKLQQEKKSMNRQILDSSPYKGCKEQLEMEKSHDHQIYLVKE